MPLSVRNYILDVCGFSSTEIESCTKIKLQRTVILRAWHGKNVQSLCGGGERVCIGIQIAFLAQKRVLV